MLQLNTIREEKDRVLSGLKKRNFKELHLIDNIIALDEKRRATQLSLDETLAKSNNLSKEIGNLFKAGETDKANALKEQTATLKEDIKTLTDTLNTTVNLIATYEQGVFKSNIKRVGVIGKDYNSDIFDKSFVENMILAISLTLDITYEESFNLLLKMGIVNTDYGLVYDKNNIILLYEGKSLSFYVRDENVIFNIENE